MGDDEYRTIENAAVGEFKDRGSHFISYADPISNKEEFKKRLTELKKQHPKAAHYCFAYRIGMDKNDFRVGDDGEPAGSAGRPILGQIDSKQLTNVLVVVVRYFGGTLLGITGLIKAYRTASAIALEASKLIIKPMLIHYRLHFDYTKMNDIMKLIRKVDGEILRQELQLFCKMEVAIPIKRTHEFLQEVNGREEDIATAI
jgi:uncharacterized YigZ family protein